MNKTNNEPRIEAFRAIAFLLSGLIFFLRRPSSLLNPQLWAEDAVIFFDQAFHLGIDSLVESYAGYLHTVPRLVALAAQHFSAVYTPCIFAWSAFLTTLVSIGLLMFVRVQGNVWFGPCLALAASIVPHIFPEIFWSLTNVQWTLSILLISLLVADSTPSGVHATIRSTMIFLAGTSTPLGAAFIPIALWRTLREERSFARLMPFIASLLAGLIQGYQLLHNDTQANLAPLSSPADVVRIIGMRVLLQGFLPKPIYIKAFDLPWLEFLIGILGLCALAVVIVRARRMREPMLLFGSMAAVLFLAAITRADAGSSHYLLDPAMDGWGDRYFYVLRVVLAAFLILGILESKRRNQWFLAGFLCLMTVSAMPRHMAAPLQPFEWREYAHYIDAKMPANIPINPSWTYKFRPNPPDGKAITYEVRLEIPAERAGIFQVFYSSDPTSFREPDSDAQPFRGDCEFQTLGFSFQVTDRFTLRLDPGSNTGKIRLRNIELWRNGERLGRIPILSLTAQNDIVINTSETSDNLLVATVRESGIDPILLVPQEATDSLLP